MSRRLAGLAAVGLLGWITPAVAQPTPHAGAARALPRLTAPQRVAAIHRIEAELRTGYVFPELRPKLVERLERGLQAGRYDVDDPGVFAERITDDLHDESHDGHLSLLLDPAGYAAALAPAKSDAGDEARDRRDAERSHHGLAALELLPGNLRYLKIAQFHWVDDATGAAYDDAVRFLRGGDAIVLDLRGNPGGSHPAVQYLISHFLAPGTLEATFLDGDTTTQSRALSHLPAGRLQGIPLYVLIDHGTGSAAEAFAYDVQQFKLGELVGQTTAGAANNNRFAPVAPTFLLSVSFGRPVHAVSHGNWEGTGVAPTVAVPPDQALDAAQSLALARLGQTRGARPEAIAEYAWARIAVEARLHPPVIPATELATYAARYRELAVVARDGGLWLVRAQRPDARLIPLTRDGTFAVDGPSPLRVRFTPRTLELLWPGLPARSFPRG